MAFLVTIHLTQIAPSPDPPIFREFEGQEEALSFAASAACAAYAESKQKSVTYYPRHRIAKVTVIEKAATGG